MRKKKKKEDGGENFYVHVYAWRTYRDTRKEQIDRIYSMIDYPKKSISILKTNIAYENRF
jgi:hypothetical protein